MKYLFLQLVIPVFLLILWSNCANVQSPNGGPKDKRPPRLVNSIPTPNQTSFKSVAIELTFDEAVKLNTPREEIIISPSPGKDVQYQAKGNKVSIIPMLPWQENTTYTILFREGVQDVTESNSPLNLKLAFSTGPTIDSLILAGNVIDLLEGKPKDKITVAIYASDTFDIFNHTPSYFTKTNKQGNFKLENIRAGRYKIYAFDDTNKNLKVESRSEMYGFLPSYIPLTEDMDTLLLGLIKLDSRPLKLSSIRNVGTVTRLRFSKFLTNYQISAPKEIVHAFGDNQTELTLWNPQGDSTEIRLSATDSLGNVVDSIFYIKRTNLKPVVEKFTLSILSPTINPENARLLSTLEFSKPILSINPDSIYIHVDSVTRIPLTMENLSYNAQHKTIAIVKDLDKRLFGTDQDPLLMLMTKPTFLISADADSSRASSSSIVIFWPEENGTLSLQATTKQKGYIIQLLDNASRKIVAQAVNTPKLTARNIPPSEYQIRIIIDSNQNGKWDPGNILRDIEPEKIIYYRAEDGAVSFPIRANWEVGPLQLRF